MANLERITGTEMEWGVAIKPSADSEWGSPDFKKEILAHFLPEGLWSVNQFLSNGARYYLDIGNHIEYATPEDTSFMGTVANEIAGEYIVRNTLEQLAKEGIISKFWLSKRLVDDSAELSWGHHESYLVPSDKISISQDSLALLGIHMATRNIWAGAGGLVNTGNGQKDFMVSQKTQHLDHDFLNGSTGQHKPLVNLRDEPLADAKWKRVHNTSGDANMSPWAMWMSLATTSIILRLIEEGKSLSPKVAPNIPLIKLASIVSGDTSLCKTVPLANGQRVTPLNIQIALAEAAQTLHDQQEVLTQEEEFALAEWRRVLDDLEAKRLEVTLDRIKWLARRAIICSYIDKYDPPKDKKGRERIENVDRLWDEISPDGIGLKYRKTLWSHWMPDESRIVRAITRPPMTTRAQIRGDFVRENRRKSKKSLTVTWNEVGQAGSRHRKLGNPYVVQ